MTDDEYNGFFGADPKSFQSLYLSQIAMISTQFKCLNAKNCTADELATIQWGSSALTLYVPD